MKYYIVKWQNKESYFTDVKEAIIAAENISEEFWCDSCVIVENDGVREKDPFFRCELEF